MSGHTPGPTAERILAARPTQSELAARLAEALAGLETARKYLRAKNFDAGGRDAVAFVVETAIAKSTGGAS